MKWSNKKPKVSGHYWLRQYAGAHDHYAPTIVKVKIDPSGSDPDWDWKEECVFFLGHDVPMDLHKVDGLWSGPIPPPK